MFGAIQTIDMRTAKRWPDFCQNLDVDQKLILNVRR